MNRRIAICVIFLISFLLAGSVAEAAEPDSTGRSGLHWLDWVMIILYAAGTIFLGVHFGRKQKSSEEYFTGGGQMNALLIGVSLFATLLSTISYLGMPGEAAGKGPVYFVQALAHPITFLIVGFLMLPQYMKYRVTSAYELLEMRLGYQFRILGAVLFLWW